jgi:TonB family protein
LLSHTAPRRVTKELFDLEFKAYYNKVGARIQSRWVYAGTDKELEAVLSIKIARSGELKKIIFEKRSRNADFDDSALRAVKKAAPFPPLPEEIGGDFLELGVRFCPGGCKQLL